MNTQIVRFVFLTVLTIAAGGCATTKGGSAPAPVAPVKPQASVVRDYATVNGLRMYYEIHGASTSPDQVPLLLIHGGGSSIDVTWGKTLPHFAARRKVIAIDEQAHGKSGDRKQGTSFTQTADDVAELIHQLGIEKIDVAGFSNGASSAMQFAIRHPMNVRKLIFISSFTKKSGAQPGFFDFMKKATFENMPQPLKDAFLKENPDPAKLHNMYERDVTRMQNFKETSDRDVANIKIPTLLMAGDHDVVPVSHYVDLAKKIKNSRILILPGQHGDFLGEAGSTIDTPVIRERAAISAALINQFLDGVYE